jgi:uncharacterized protein YxjI
VIETISYLTGTSKIFSKRVIEIVGDIWRKNLYEVYIDEKVTMDISRLVRIIFDKWQIRSISISSKYSLR